MTITISLEDFADEIEDLGDDLEEAAQRALESSALRLEGIVAETITEPTPSGLPAPVDTGDLLRSVHTSGTEVIASAPHAAVIEFGSRPHRPPIAPLAAWAYRKGLADSDEEAEKVARSIAEKIAKHGTEPRFYMRRSIQKLKSRKIIPEEIRVEFEKTRKGRRGA